MVDVDTETPKDYDTNEIIGDYMKSVCDEDEKDYKQLISFLKAKNFKGD